MGRIFDSFVERYNQPLTGGGTDDPKDDVFASTQLQGPPRGFGLTPNQLQNVRDLAAYSPGGAAFLEYMGETYLVNGEEQSVGSLFSRIWLGQVDQAFVQRVLTPRYDANGELQNGATWFPEFTKTFNKYYDLSLGNGQDDGATLQEKIDSALAIIQDRVRTLGLRMSETDIIDVATMAVNSNWNDAQVIDKLLTNYNMLELDAGDLTTAQSNVATLANQYLVPLTDDQAASYAKRLYLGEINTDTIEDQFRKQLIAEMPFLETQLMSGLRPTDIFASARSFAARELELDANNIDLNDPKWRDMFVRSNDDGTQRLATLSEIRTQVRNTPEWSRTTAAKESASNIAGAIAQLFGRSGF